MKIGIYNEPEHGSLGGSEYLVGRLAGHLAQTHDVELVVHKPAVTAAALSAFCSADLTAVSFRVVTPDPNPFSPFHASWSRLRAAREWHTALSAPYDIFINSTHGVPPFCRAAHGVLLVLFPFFSLAQTWPWKEIESDRRHPVRARIRRALYNREWQARFASYDVKLAISQYSRDWTKSAWGIDCGVVYPPVDCAFASVAKEPLIISVGRFVARGVSKKQREMVRTFVELESDLPAEWRYSCLGALSDNPEDREYADAVRQVAGEGEPRAVILTNTRREDLIRWYQKASIFWHATGFGESLAHPDQAEHFGISTVEAMAAGCVPVVINRGAQPEIVEHGISGFVWDTLEELKVYTLRLATDSVLRMRMSEAAQRRAEAFSEAHFAQKMTHVVDSLAREHA